MLKSAYYINLFYHVVDLGQSFPVIIEIMTDSCAWVTLDSSGEEGKGSKGSSRGPFLEVHYGLWLGHVSHGQLHTSGSPGGAGGLPPLPPPPRLHYPQRAEQAHPTPTSSEPEQLLPWDAWCGGPLLPHHPLHLLDHVRHHEESQVRPAGGRAGRASQVRSIMANPLNVKSWTP